VSESGLIRLQPNDLLTNSDIELDHTKETKFDD